MLVFHEEYDVLDFVGLNVQVLWLLQWSVTFSVTLQIHSAMTLDSAVVVLSASHLNSRCPLEAGTGFGNGKESIYKFFFFFWFGFKCVSHPVVLL